MLASVVCGSLVVGSFDVYAIAGKGALEEEQCGLWTAVARSNSQCTLSRWGHDNALSITGTTLAATVAAILVFKPRVAANAFRTITGAFQRRQRHLNAVHVGDGFAAAAAATAAATADQLGGGAPPAPPAFAVGIAPMGAGGGAGRAFLAAAHRVDPDISGAEGAGFADGSSAFLFGTPEFVAAVMLLARGLDTQEVEDSVTAEGQAALTPTE